MEYKIHCKRSELFNLPLLLGLTQQKGVNFDLPIGGNNRSFFNVVGIELFIDFQTLCNFVFFSGNKKDVV